MISTLKRKVFNLLHPQDDGTIAHRIITGFIITLILLNVLCVIFETIDSFYIAYKAEFIAFDVFSVIIFTIEYLLRLWTCTEIKRYSHPVKGRIKYIFSVGSIIDLLAVVPFYLPLVTVVDLRFMRMFRLMRFMRFFKLGRYMSASRIIANVVRAKKEELVVCLMITLSLVVLASSLMYFVEHDVQPDKFSSIPQTMWWSVTTLTTVGYGDVFPVTALGRVLTAVISILGVGIFALPAGILASGFSEEFSKMKHHGHHTCPHCGKEL